MDTPRFRFGPSSSTFPSAGDRNRTCGLLVQSQTQLPTVATPGQVMRRTERGWLSLRQARGRGFEPLSPDSKSGSLPLADPRIRFIESAMRESNPPIQLGRLAPLPIGQWHSFLLQRKERESNSQGSVSARPLSRRLPSPIGLPFRIPKLRWQESNLHSSA